MTEDQDSSPVIHWDEWTDLELADIIAGTVKDLSHNTLLQGLLEEARKRLIRSAGAPRYLNPTIADAIAHRAAHSSSGDPKCSSTAPVVKSRSFRSRGKR